MLLYSTLVGIPVRPWSSYLIIIFSEQRRSHSVPRLSEGGRRSFESDRSISSIPHGQLVEPGCKSRLVPPAMVFLLFPRSSTVRKLFPIGVSS